MQPKRRTLCEVSVRAERLGCKILVILKLKKRRRRKRDRETLKEEKETTNVEICLHKGEVDLSKKLIYL